MDYRSIKFRIGMASALAVAMALAGCGGGSSSGSPSAHVVLSGTATIGTAIASAPVNVKCQAASGSATTQADGTYSVTVSGTLPCVLELTIPTDNTRLHSVATGSGSSATSNITPLTELTVAALTKQNPATAYASFDANAATTMTSDAVKTAQTEVVSYLAANKVDVTALANTDLISTPITASGNAQADVIGQVEQKITTPITEVAANLATAPSGCPVAKSGKYNVFSYTGAKASYTVDFAAKTILLPGDTTATAFNESSTHPCEFTGGDVTVNFASSGVAIYKVASTGDIGIAFPVQTFNKGVFGDTYNLAGYFANGGGFAAPDSNVPNAQTGTMKINADGSARICPEQDYSDQCTFLGNAFTSTFSGTPNADGSDDAVFPDGSTGKFYSYTAPNGEKMLVLGDTNSLIIAAKQAAVDSSTIALNSSSVYYSVKGYTGFGNGATLSTGTNTVTAVAATQYTTLQHVDDGVTADSTLVTLLNNPWAGMRHRDADVVNNTSARTGMSTRLGFSTNGSVNKIVNGVVTPANTAIFSFSVSR